MHARPTRHVKQNEKTLPEKDNRRPTQKTKQKRQHNLGSKLKGSKFRKREYKMHQIMNIRMKELMEKHKRKVNRKLNRKIKLQKRKKKERR